MTENNVEHFRRATLESEPIWGKANPKRGIAYPEGHTKNYVDYAKDFINLFPVGTLLTTLQFDMWLQEKELLTIPPEDSEKNSDAWMGHLQRRHQHRTKINKAASHPRMVDEGSNAFTITAINGGYEVRAPHIAVSKNEVARRISSLTVTKRRQLEYLMQSADWTILPVHERAIAEELFFAISEFEEDTVKSASRIEQKLLRLESRIRAAIKAGEVKPKSDALRMLVDQRDITEDEEEGIT